MLWFIYNVLFAIGYTLMLPRFLLRMWRRGGYKQDFLQRFGTYAPEVEQKLRTRQRIWIHAVSVGEMQVALRFADEMRTAELGDSFVFTTTTSTGHAMGKSKIGGDDILLYFPSDFPFIVKRVLNTINPRALILTECELWPNLIRHASKRKIPVILINGRISESSYRGYKLMKVFFRKIAACIDLFLVQTPVEEQYLIELGADKARIKVMGTAKYDTVQSNPTSEKKARDVLADLDFAANAPVLLGASTWESEEFILLRILKRLIGVSTSPSEERVLLDIFKRLRTSSPELKLVLVPRHAERRAEVEAEIKSAGLSWVKRSDQGKPAQEPDILLIDTTGELMGFYYCATVVFVGKSLTNHGGQNVIEPALYSETDSRRPEHGKLCVHGFRFPVFLGADPGQRRRRTRNCAEIPSL